MKLLDPVPGVHVQMQLALEEDRTMLSFGGGGGIAGQSVALSARSDMRMRRHINGIRYPGMKFLSSSP